MIRIAIVDDQTEAISEILSVFQQWEKENHVYFEIDTYTDADLFCDAIFDKKYQALFLDLDMPKKSGFDISQFLRELGNNTPIVYITNRDDLMQKAFQYKVLGFARKDKIQEELPFAISCVIQEIQKKNNHVMIFAAHRQKKNTIIYWFLIFCILKAKITKQKSILSAQQMQSLQEIPFVPTWKRKNFKALFQLA